MRDSQAEISAIFDNVPIVMILVDREWQVRRVNRATVEFTGRPAEAMIGLSGGEALRCLHSLGNHKGCGVGPICEMCPMRRTVLDTLETSKRHQQVKTKLSLARGEKQEEMDLLVSTAPLSISGSQIVLVCIEDITGRKRAEGELRRTLEKLRKALGATIQAMAFTVETRDPYTAGHQRQVANFARAIATEMGLSKEQIEGIRMAAVIHDIGKIAVPTDILNKPGQLTKYEFSIIQGHPEVGHNILKEIEFPWPIAQIVFQHHERMDGSGYPQGLSGEEIIVEARVLAVADVVEAMVSCRPYRTTLGIDKALREISQNRSVLYDPEVVDVCLKLFTEKGFTFD